jgi:hypothetical protein
MEKKDKITISIASVALLVSIISFAFSEIREINRQNIEESKVSYQSFTLGEKYCLPFVTYIQTTKGKKEEIDKTKSDALFDLKVVQGLADYMNLKIQLVEYVRNYSMKTDPNSFFSKKPVLNIIDRIDAIYGTRASASFRLGFWLPWLYINASISTQKEYEQETEKVMRKGYGSLVDQINIDLKTLDIDKRLNWDNREFKDLPDSTIELKRTVKDILSERIK